MYTRAAQFGVRLSSPEKNVVDAIHGAETSVVLPVSFREFSEGNKRTHLSDHQDK